MPEKIIYNGQIHHDDWHILRLAETDNPATISVPASTTARYLIPLSVWQAQQITLQPALQNGLVSLWLTGTDHPADIAELLPQLKLIAVDFPKFADGRGYSVASLLRSRYHYRGELRAIGEVLRDQFTYLTRCGFNSLQPPEGKYTSPQLEAALVSLHTFSEPYQGAIDTPEPLFRRRNRNNTPAPVTENRP